MIDYLLLIFRVLVFPGFTFIFFFTLFCDWVERKVEARMQNRMGPTFTGPGGILQPIADFIKMLTKEEITPSDSKRNVFRFAPILALSVLIFALAFLPIDGTSVIPGVGFAGDLIFVMALVSVANFMLFLAGWSSTNPYSAIGGARVLTQFLGYDIPLLLLALAPAFLAGSLTISTIVSSQWLPYAILAPWAFVLFIITMQAELEKDPFDVPHAESEVVAGHETEYSGGKLAFLKLARDVQIVFGASLITVLFLGGANGPVPFGFLPEFWGTLWFALKVIGVVIVSEYLTVLFARLRIDQVVRVNWRIILPLTVLSLILTISLAYWIYPIV
ncbi:MAG: NADH-quinone oxidoreductase subunit H [Candidatus Bathyarchaeota archaeon]|nr:NADH-quinone oxidoreductase subunit H [Candidatus Bathyarchaeota archaeon]